MKNRMRMLALFCLLPAVAVVTAAQNAAPSRPPSPPAPAAMPAPAPRPAIAPLPPVPPDADSLMWEAQAQADEAQAKVQEKMAEVQQRMAQAQEDMQSSFQDRLGVGYGVGYGLGSGVGSSIAGALASTQLQLDMLAQATPMPSPAPMARYGMLSRNASADSLYSRGQSALDRRRWDEALQDFTEAASKGGNRADGALYWKAYSLDKLGRRDEALATIADLRKSYPSSRWLDDAKALEVEVKQSSGQPVSADSQPDDETKLIALNGLMQSNPDSAIPAIQSVLKGAQSPRVKEQALFVLAQSGLPKAQQIVEQVARGTGNPDLQVKAIQYLGATSRDRDRGRRAEGQPQPTNNGPLLSEIYNASADVNVKRAVLNSLSASRDSDRLLQIAKTEKTPELRLDAVRRLTAMRTPAVSDALVAMYSSEQDKEVKRAIISSLASQDNVKQLVAAARTEKDPEMVRYLVSRLAGMKSPEAAEYLMEIIKK